MKQDKKLTLMSVRNELTQLCRLSDPPNLGCAEPLHCDFKYVTICQRSSSGR